MVKHWKRTHQRGPHSPEMDDMISDGGSESSPSTPDNQPVMPWHAQHAAMMAHPGHHLHRPASYADFGQPMNNYGLPQQYNHRHSLSSGGPAEYHGAPMHPHSHGQQQQQQHQNVQMLQRTASLSHHQGFFVPDQNNPGVATMATAPQYHAQIPRQSAERLPLEIPTYPGAPDLAGGMGNGSPNSFATTPGRSPSGQDAGYYTHVAPGQSAAYTLHNASPVAQQPPQMMAFPQGAVPAQPQAVDYPQQPQPQPQQPEQPQQQEPPQQWFEGAEYQPPVGVQVEIGSLPPYGTTGMYVDPWAPKLEFEDAGMQMPSARVASM